MHLHLRFRRIVALVAGLLLTLSIHAQVITKSFRGVPLKTVLEEVEKQTGYSFLFESKEVDVDKPVTASFKNATIQTVLDKVLDGSLRYTINDKLVTISQRPRQGATVAKDGSVTLSGTVISSSDNQPIVGANVYVEGTTLGVTTDIDGNYSLTVPASTRQVTFSFLGYDMKKIAVKDSELFKLVTLVDASNELEDVVVVGFGVQKKESLVGAVQSVKPSELQVSSSNLSTSFAGKIAGVIAVQKTGEPGADGANFWIRGISTFGSGQSPLLILDGVADLCNDPNDLHESEALVCELMRWSCEYDNHILCVLHSNPGGDKARGHLGSALLRKSETVMLVKADGDTSVVSPQYCRNEPFTEFAFRINAEVLPELCSIPAPQPKENVFAEVMVSGKVYTHSELVEELMKVVDLKEGSAKSKISRAVKAGTIVKNQVGGYYLLGSQIEVSQPELHDEPF